MMLYPYADSPHGWGFVLMAVGVVLFWGVLVLGVVALVRHLRRGERPVVAAPDAREILDERFARGEIDEPEYAMRLEALSASARSRA